ncbi:MAG TPA: LLM class flavin-dependent oxidoreductase [Chloroflexota bacterium]|nr:LLM class flavin-dependent oxidoreductase [Chloroflexota bacterium]
MTVNAATRGRLALGIGPAHRPSVERLGLSYEHVARHVREYLSVLRPLIHEGSVQYEGTVFRVTSTLRIPGAQPCLILLSALAPLMLQAAGQLADGTITWMVGQKTLATHIVPRITAAAQAARRPAPRVALGVPVAVCDEEQAGRERANRTFQGYRCLSNYRRMLDLEGVEEPGDVAICGTEAQVERQLRAVAALGATDVLATIYPVGEDAPISVARTRTFLKSLVGTL